jgi:hypothetical protein
MQIDAAAGSAARKNALRPLNFVNSFTFSRMLR